ncbi:hypothetical protein [Streptomyces sp. NBC_00391]|uniref:hypothetical protein n=1 Tax=Streptomyces sp. NBC_00391 TaxID=2903647 RepID=UPI002E1BB57A
MLVRRRPTVIDGGAALSAAGVSSGFEQVHAAPAPRGETVVVTVAVAAAHGWRKGQVAPLTLEDGRTRKLRATAVVDDSMPYQVLLPRDLVRDHYPSALADFAYRTTHAPTRLPAGLGADEISVEAYAASDDAEEDRLVWVFTLMLVAVSAGYTAIAVASTLLTATAGRVRDFRVLRLSGATPRQVLLGPHRRNVPCRHPGRGPGPGGGSPGPVRHGPRPSRGAGPASGVVAGPALAHGRGDRPTAARHGGHRPPGPRRPAAYAAGVNYVSNRPQGPQEAAALPDEDIGDPDDQRAGPNLARER